MMNWNQLISNCRLGQEHRHPERHDDRTEFKRDYDRLIFSAPFRRLQNKTQVFPLPGSDPVVIGSQAQAVCLYTIALLIPLRLLL